MSHPSASIAARPAHTGDVDQITDLVDHYWAFEQIAGFDRRTVRQQLTRLITSDQLGTALVATHEHTLIGYLLLVYVFSLEHRGLTAEIDELFVLTESRSQGHGAALLRLAETIAVSRGCSHLSLQLGRQNGRGRSFYQRHGFSRRGGFELLEKHLASP